MADPAGAINASPAAGAATTVKARFSDVPADNVNVLYINYLNARGIISGYPDGSYHPGDGLTRAQAAVILCKAAGLQTPVVKNSSFKDLRADYWAVAYIEAAVKAGYLKGFPDGSYQPEARLTRAQGISLVMRLCTRKERAALPGLQDMDSTHWAAQDMGTALTLEMIGLSADGKKVYPEAQISRGSLARALAILLTKDPGLNPARLAGRIKEIKGSVTLIREGKNQEIKEDSPIYQGDEIETGDKSSVSINYPDGSSTLVDSNSVMSIKQADGRSYIKQDGTSGIAVELLNIDLKKGTIFGALATKHENESSGDQADITTGSSIQPGPQSNLRQKLAARPGFNYLAAANPAENGQPWYQTAEKKKVRIKVDMPWGIAAIRGTFARITVNPDGSCNVSCLTGHAEIKSSSSNQFVPITAGQASGISEAAKPASDATPMSEKDKQDFNGAQAWIVNTALQQDVNMEAQIAPAIAVEIAIPNAKPGDQQVQERAVEPKGETEKEQQAQTIETTVKTVIDAFKSCGIELKAEVIENLKQQIKEVQNQVEEQTARDLQNEVSKAANPNTNTVPSATPSGSSNNSGTNSSSPAVLILSQPGTYGPGNPSTPLTVNSVALNSDGIILQNVKVINTMTMGSDIADGSVFLKNVTVAGNTLINGGGSSSIHIEDSQLGTVTVNKGNNSIRVVAEGSTSLGTVTLSSGAILEESGLSGTSAGFSDVIAASGITAGTPIVLCGNLASLNVNAPDLNIQVQGGSIGQLNITGTVANTQLNLAAGTSVQNLTVNSPANIGGTGQILTALINASGAVIAQVPANWTVAAGISATIGGDVYTGTDNIRSRAKLASLSLSAGSLSPVFSADSLSYTANVTNSVYSVTIYAVPESVLATVAGTGPVNLNYGNNQFNVAVTAQDGTTTKTYSLTINRSNMAALLTTPANYSVPLPGFATGTTRIASLNLISGASQWQYKLGSSAFNIPDLDSTVSGAVYYAANADIAAVAGQNLLLLATDTDGKVKGYADISLSYAQMACHTYEFVRQFGASAFSSPEEIALNAAGDSIFITDYNNNRVVVLSSSGQYIRAWGSNGTGNGQFKHPYGIAVDGSGNVFVADLDNDRIEKFDSLGNYITKWGGTGTGNSQFNAPAGVAVDSSGNVYVTDCTNNNIKKFNNSGTFITKWGSAGSSNGLFNQPRGVAVDSQGNVYVADQYNHCIQKFTTTDGITYTFALKWGKAGGTAGTGNGEFNLPYGVSVDNNGYVYVADRWNNRIQKFDAAGTFLSKLGKADCSAGSGNGEFNNPADIIFDAVGNLFVADKSNKLIQKFRRTDFTGNAETLVAGNDYVAPVPGATVGTTVITSLNLIGGATQWQYKVDNGALPVPVLNSLVSGISPYTANADVAITAGQHLWLLATDAGGRVRGYADNVINSTMISYAVNSLEDLAAISSKPTDGYILLRNLDFTDPASYASGSVNPNWISGGAGWTPLSNFSGVFNGNGHTISHLYISSASSGLGLFTYIASTGTVKNLGLPNVSITGTGGASQANIGSLAGKLYGYIRNSYATGVVSCTGDQVGGLVGTNDDATIIACSSSVNVTGRSSVGGISGKCGLNNSVPLVQDCYVTGNVSGTGTATGENERIGGIIGNALTARIVRSYASGNISGKAYVGGLAGWLGSSGDASWNYINNSYALNGTVSLASGSATTIGKIAGYKNNAAINSCYANSAMSIPGSNSGLNGAGVILNDAKLKTTYYDNGWSIEYVGISTTTTWVISNDSSSYPLLR